MIFSEHPAARAGPGDTCTAAAAPRVSGRAAAVFGRSPPCPCPCLQAVAALARARRPLLARLRLPWPPARALLRRSRNLHHMPCCACSSSVLCTLRRCLLACLWVFASECRAEPGADISKSCPCKVYATCVWRCVHDASSTARGQRVRIDGRVGAPGGAEVPAPRRAYLLLSLTYCRSRCMQLRSS